MQLPHLTNEIHLNQNKRCTLSDRVFPRQNSAPISSSLLPSALVEYGMPPDQWNHGGISAVRRSEACISCDASDSDDDGCNSEGERPEPRTLFEAALRRARLADSQREVRFAKHETFNHLVYFLVYYEISSNALHWIYHLLGDPVLESRWRYSNVNNNST